MNWPDQSSHPGFVENLKHLFGHLPRRRRWQFAALVPLVLLGAAAEMATLAAVMSFLAVLTDPTGAANNSWLRTLSSYLGRSGNENVLFSAASLFAIIAFGGAALRVLLTWASANFTFALGTDIGCEIYRRTLYQPYRFDVLRNSSKIISGLNKVQEVIRSIIGPLVQGLAALILSIAILGTLIRIDPFTALVTAGTFAALFIIIALYTRPRLERNGNEYARNETRRVQAVEEALGGIRDVLIDGVQSAYIARFESYTVAKQRAQANSQFISAAPRFLVEAVGMVIIVFLAYLLNHRQGGLGSSIPVLGALALGGQKLLPQMQQLYASYSAARGNGAILADVVALLEQPIPSEYLQAPSPDGLRLSRQITMRNVSFRYKDDLPDIICGVTLEIQRGSRVGFIGKTGGGKSTLLDLIMGLLEPTSGSVEIDGEPLISGNRRAWQTRIAHVPQAIYLTDASIAENIAFGVDAARIDIERVIAAAQKAQLAAFIESLPDKYQTHVGERGVRLSGGQRQRIGIARALYKQADVMVFDEATSALDDATESSVMQAINALGKNITVLIIAHRLSTLRNCDKIIDFGHGKVLRTGSFQKLIQADHESKSALSLGELC